MPLGEIIGEVILRAVLEPVLCGLSYWTGFLILKAISLGAIRLAPLTSLGEKGRNKRKWYQVDWSIWHLSPKRGRALKAEFTCLVGCLVWIAVGIGIFHGLRSDKPNATETSMPTHHRQLVQSSITMRVPAFMLQLEMQTTRFTKSYERWAGTLGG